MGLGKYAPNAALLGDMGWQHPLYHQWISISRQWCRMVNMTSDCVNKRIFNWACGQNKLNWCKRVRNFYRDLQMDHLCNTEYYLVVGEVINDLETVLSEHYEVKWHAIVNRPEAARGPGRNKLRTYKIFKESIKTEHYLFMYNKRHRSAMAKFRAGVAPLRLETGRYDNTNEVDRVCFHCTDRIESEEHVLLNCPLYNDLRNDLFIYANTIDVEFVNMLPGEKLIFLLSKDNIVNMCAKTLCDILTRRRSLLYDNA